MLRLVTRLPPAQLQRSVPYVFQFLYFPLRTANRTLPQRQCRTFVSSPALYKKKDKAKQTTPQPDRDVNAKSEDPFDLSQLESGISTAVSRLKDDLSKLRAGGRFNTTSLETLKVSLSKDSHDNVRLGDLAQIVPKGGRMVTILVAEEEVSMPLFLARLAQQRIARHNSNQLILYSI